MRKQRENGVEREEYQKVKSIYEDHKNIYKCIPNIIYIDTYGGIIR